MGTERNDAASRRDMGVQIVMRWGDAVVAARDVGSAKAVRIGEGEAGQPVDFTVPEDKLGVRRAPLILPAKEGDRGPRAVIVKGASMSVERGEQTLSLADLEKQGLLSRCEEIEGARSFVMRPGDLVTIDVDDIRFELRAGGDVEEAMGRVRWGQVRRFGSGTALSLFAHIGVVIAAVYFGSRPTDPDTLDAERAEAIQQYLARADEKQIAELEAAQAADQDNKEGGAGTRAKGEQGSMGAKDARNGAQEPSDQADPHVSRAQANQDAAEFGMIGLLSSGSGGDPNAPVAPWGRDDSLGRDPMSARGNMWGGQITDEFGTGGIVLGGAGTGGGGRGEGIGLGSIGTIGHGAGTGTAQGFGNGAGTGTGQGFGSGHGRIVGTSAASSPRASSPSPATPPPPAAAVRAVVEDPHDTPINPNGRFATTYRPGGGHLAAFEAAVARGVIPAAEREVVSDVGARYFADVSIPEGKALGLRADMERASLPPSGGAFHLRLSMKSAQGADVARPDLGVTLVLDVSGSMEGPAIRNARGAAHKLVDRLADNDRFSLVTFSSDAKLLVPIGVVGARRGFIHATIDKIETEGGTNISEGLRMGYVQAASKSIPEDAVRTVMLLSDGHANAGVTSSSSLARMALDAFQNGIETSSFGLGESYDGPLMSAIAGDGAGGYYYLRDSEQIAPALAIELDKRMEPVATAVEVRVRLADKIDLLRVYGSKRLGVEEAERVRTQEVAADTRAAKQGIKRDRQEDTQGGMRFFIPAFARDDSHALLLKLRAPEGAQARKVAIVELRYKDRISKKNVTVELPVSINYADSDASSAASADASVARTVQGFLAGEALMTAASLVGDGNPSGASALLGEREAILRTAAEQLGEPGFLRDANRLARLRTHTTGNGSMSEPLALAMLLETAGRSHMR